MRHFRQFSTLLFIAVIFYLILGCETEKPNQPIENAIDTIALSNDSLVDTTSDTIIDTTTIPDNFMIKIEKVRDAIQGLNKSIEITMHNPSSDYLSIGSFDFLLRYDAGIINLQSVEAGQFVTDCGWEYFTYRYDPHVYGDPLVGEIRITAVADINNVPNQPTCFNDSGAVSNQLAVLNFIVSNNRIYECSTASVQFYWYACYDNNTYNIARDKIYRNNHIYTQKFDYKKISFIDYSNDLAQDTTFPTFFGGNKSCDTATEEIILRNIDFINGGIDVVCADSVDGRGDINFNEIANEIADAVLFANYFLYGLSVFTVNANGQPLTTDVNADGQILSVADLVYLIRIINGDALPYPTGKPIQDITPIYPTVTRIIDDGTLFVDRDMGAMLIVIEGNVSYELLDSNMTVQSNFDGTNTHILVYSLEGNTFSGEFLKVLGNIVSIEFGSSEGGPVILTK